MKLILSTSRYQAPILATHPGVKVRTTIGRPRMKLPYEIGASVQLLAPYGLFGKGYPPDEFALHYIARLNAKGLDRIRGRLSEVAIAAANEQLVLLCFENVNAGEFCHRRVFAQWWEGLTGEAVPELPDQGSA